jgi:hypothetical protein
MVCRRGRWILWSGDTYGRRIEKAATTRYFVLVFMLSRATRYIEMRNMEASVIMSRAVMARHLDP